MTPDMAEYFERVKRYAARVEEYAAQVEEYAKAVGWTPPRPTPLKGAKCIVKGCTNYHGDGIFFGEICAPCYTMLTTGNAGYNSTFVGDLYQKAAQLEEIRSNIRKLF